MTARTLRLLARWGDLGGNGQPPPTVSVPPWQLVTTTLFLLEPVERCGVKFHIFNRIVLLRQIGGTSMSSRAQSIASTVRVLQS